MGFTRFFVGPPCHRVQNSFCLSMCMFKKYIYKEFNSSNITMPAKITTIHCLKLTSTLRSTVEPQCFVPCQPLSRHNSAALGGSMALSHFLHRFWSELLGQPTSLYSSVNSGKKALISFLPPRRWLWRRCEKPSLRATALLCVPSWQSELLSLLFVSLNAVVSPLRKKNQNTLVLFPGQFQME